MEVHVRKATNLQLWYYTRNSHYTTITKLCTAHLPFSAEFLGREASLGTLERYSLDVDAFSLQLRSFNALVSGSMMDMYFEFKNKNAVHQALQYMRKKPLIDLLIHNR